MADNNWTEKDLEISRKERLKEEQKQTPLEQKLKRGQVHCPRCGVKNELLKRYVEIEIQLPWLNKPKKVKIRGIDVYKCPSCKAEMIPDMHLNAICCYYGREKLISVVPQQCKRCSAYRPKNGKPGSVCKFWLGYLSKTYAGDEWKKA